jgi:hypothetical protein
MKATLKATKMLHRQAATKQAIHQMEHQAEEKTPFTTEEVLDGILPGYARMNPDQGIGLSGDVQRQLDAQQSAMLRAAYLNTTNARLSAEEIKAASQETFNEVSKMFKNNEILDFKLAEPDATTGVQRIAIYLGRPYGEGGYTAEQTAIKAAERRGFTDFKVENRDGKFFIRVDHSVPELGLINVGDVSEIKSGIFSGLLNPNTWMPKRIT